MAIGTTIPVNLIKQLIPVLMQQVDTLSAESEKFINQVLQLPSDIQCNDPRIRAAKLKLQSLYDLIDTIKQGLDIINSIVPVISTISTVASTLKIVQLAIPAVPGVPTGPVTELINTFDSLGKNAKSSVSSLQGMVSAINIQFARINQSLAKAIRKLSAICNTEIFDVSTDINDALLNLEYTDDVPTQFYTELNVSDEDITSRLSLIEQLVTEQLNVLQNLKEAPSKVLSGIQTPITDIGDIGDYYIDTDSQLIYGPKTELGWGSGINI
ncbi:hypothetical protein UFOVP723_160 [uncultured Caudovirales phage]|jgi:hypothetical protein|uniref:Uncharacterized protein n=1 Tax=uncultured Caudovirales phage TaxID=2100421 RepID=A0A6J5NNG1_9CAUD|nr:hypothetical protein UFOVP723_160 [uncultured Caudovirales phage]